MSGENQAGIRRRQAIRDMVSVTIEGNDIDLILSQTRLGGGRYVSSLERYDCARMADTGRSTQTIFPGACPMMMPSTCGLDMMTC